MRIAVIGAGKIAQRHIAAFRNLGCGQILLYDINRPLARDVSRAQGIEWVETEAEIFDASPGVVDVCTPVLTHKEIILKAIGSNKHVFCEKPLCVNLSEAREIRDAALKASKMVMIGYLYRFHPALLKAKEWVDKGLIGPIHFGVFRLGGRGNHRRWKHRKEEGGGCINEMLIHKLDLVNFYLGRLDSAEMLKREILIGQRVIEGEAFEPDAEDNVVLSVEAGGARVICQSDLASPSYMQYLELHGQNGSIFTSILEFFPTVLFLKEERGGYRRGNNLYRFESVNLFELELGHFLRCIEKGEKNANSVEDSMEILKVLAEIDGRGN